MPGDRVYPLPPWWQDRFDELDDRADRYTHWLDDPTSDGFQPAVDVDQPLVACQWDERDGNDF